MKKSFQFLKGSESDNFLFLAVEPGWQYILSFKLWLDLMINARCEQLNGIRPTESFN